MSDLPQATDLATLYQLDPLHLTKDDPRIHAMVLGLRAQRASFMQSEARGERPKTERKKKDVVPVDLKTLELDLG